MKLSKIMVLVALIWVQVIGCSKAQREGYVILKQSVLAPGEWDEVIHVYGFNNDQQVVEELTAYLNRTGPGNYKYTVAP